MTRSQRAQQCWQVLCGCAANRQIMTYGLLGKRVGLPARAFADPLGCIYFYCKKHKLPKLTVLVVEKSGKPGSGFLEAKSVDQSMLDAYREKVFNHPWDLQVPPSAKELEAALMTKGQRSTTDGQ